MKKPTPPPSRLSHDRGEPLIIFIVVLLGVWALVMLARIVGLF